MPDEHELMERARVQARAELSQDASFLQLSQTEQFERYKNRVNSIYHYLLSQPPENSHLATQQDLSGAMAATEVADLLSRPSSNGVRQAETTTSEHEEFGDW